MTCGSSSAAHRGLGEARVPVRLARSARRILLPRWGLTFAAIGASLLTSSTLWAQEGDDSYHSYPACETAPTDRELSAAQGAFEAGHVSFQEGDYERAVLYWEDAFRRDCTATKLLLNLAQAYELAGRHARAVLALETYLERNPEADSRAALEKRIEVLRKKAGEQKNAPTESAEASAPENAEPSSEEEPVTAHPGSPEPPDQRASRPLWPPLVLGAGLISAGIGAGLWIEGQSTLDGTQCTSNGSQFVCTDGDETVAESAQARRNAGIAMAVGGGALAATATVFWAVLRQDAPERTGWQLTPVLGTERLGLQLRTEF